MKKPLTKAGLWTKSAGRVCNRRGILSGELGSCFGAGRTGEL